MDLLKSVQSSQTLCSHYLFVVVNYSEQTIIVKVVSHSKKGSHEDFSAEYIFSSISLCSSCYVDVVIKEWARLLQMSATVVNPSSGKLLSQLGNANVNSSSRLSLDDIDKLHSMLNNGREMSTSGSYNRSSANRLSFDRGVPDNVYVSKISITSRPREIIYQFIRGLKVPSISSLRQAAEKPVSLS